MSIHRILEAVADVQASILIDRTNHKKYRMLSRLTEDAQIIYNVFNTERGLIMLPL